MKIAVLWPLVSGYMAACWRNLAELDGIELTVLAWRPVSDREYVWFDQELFHGIKLIWIEQDERNSFDVISSYVLEIDPDVIVVSGWFVPVYRKIALRCSSNGKAVIMAMDTCLNFSLRQIGARLVYSRFFNAIDGVLAPGERSAALARWFGFSRDQIVPGLYGCDVEALLPTLDQRRVACGGWPRVFVFVGRYVPRKGLEVLLRAYAEYRTMVSDPWDLICCGDGPLKSRIGLYEGVSDLGFVQPHQLGSVFAGSGVFVLPSTFEAWGVALVEAAASGLPLIASKNVGATDNVLQDFYNGRLFSANSVEQLASALHWFHQNDHLLAIMGSRSQALAKPYGAVLWAERVEHLCRTQSSCKSSYPEP